MNDLNTQQIVLLCLLVSFVTSIATGITVVSLMEQAPDPVSQTINRVVEKTIERVVEAPKDDEEQPVERVVETVVVNQEDLTIEAVQGNAQKVARVYRVDSAETRFFAGVSPIVRSDGTLLAGVNVQNSNKLVAVYNGGEFEMEVISENERYTLLRPVNAGDNTFGSVSFANVSGMKLAQSVIMLSGQNNNVVSSGIVTDIKKSKFSNEDGTETEYISSIAASVDQDKILRGSILLNLQGEVVAMWVGDVISGAFITANSLDSFIRGANL